MKSTDEGTTNMKSTDEGTTNMKSTDEGTTGAKAKDAISGMTTAAEIAAYVEGEERSGVLDFANAKMKAIEKAALSSADAEIAAANPTPEPAAAPTVLKQDSWRYHESEEPRIFKAGETIPEGWSAGQSTLKRLWFRDSNGAFSRIDRG